MLFRSVKNDSVAADSTKKDTITTANKFILEDLLNIADEKALIAKYGADHVKYDTIWGPEGDFGFGTYIDKGSVDAVQIF